MCDISRPSAGLLAEVRTRRSAFLGESSFFHVVRFPRAPVYDSRPHVKQGKEQMMMRDWTFLVLGLCGALALTGCGGSGGESSSSGKANCPDFCARMMTCAEQLCAEDGSPTPDAILSLLEASCSAACTPQVLEQMQPKWDCYLESSCRAVFADDACEANASYSCLSFPN